MKILGFSDISKPAMLHSVGKIMTIPKGAKMKRIRMEDILTELAKNGLMQKVRDKNKNYLGTLELVQNMGFAKEHFLPQKQNLFRRVLKTVF